MVHIRRDRRCCMDVTRLSPIFTTLVHILLSHLLEHGGRHKDKLVICSNLSAMVKDRQCLARAKGTRPTESCEGQPWSSIVHTFLSSLSGGSCRREETPFSATVSGSRQGPTDFGTATNSVSRNSEFCTRSALSTTSSNERCDKFPL